MKIAFIHNEKKLGTGANYINDLMALKLREAGVDVKNFYPKTSFVDAPVHLGGLKSILFFYSLLEKRKDILKFDIIQGTTYTPLPFLAYSTPVVCHFGSTTRGFLDSTPMAKDLKNGTRKIWYRLKDDGVITELNIKTRRPMRDIADIEHYVASRAAAVIATSLKVRQELLDAGIEPSKIHMIHNALEDYWLEQQPSELVSEPSLVFLGRLGGDAFTLKLKGVDRLIHLYQRFPNIQKHTFCMTTNKRLIDWLRLKIPRHAVFSNTRKDRLPAMLRPLCGSILFIPSRYEGFSLSLIEGMSQGLIPISYHVGVAPEIIQNGQNGFLVSSQAEAIEKIELILSDTPLRQKLSKAAMETSRQFSSDIIAEKLLELYETIVRSLPIRPKDMIHSITTM